MINMYLTTEIKKQIVTEHGTSEIDTGSTDAQVAIFTFRINHLTSHLKANHKDLVTQRSLVRLVGKRRKLLNYLKNKDIERYRALLKKLGIRK